MPEQFSNNPTTTLNGSVSSTATSIIVQDATSFPTIGNFRILIDSEIIIVTAVTGNTFTVTRGAEGTTAVAHNNAASVDGIVTKGAFDAFSSDITNNTLAHYGYNPDNPPSVPSTYNDEFTSTTLDPSWSNYNTPTTLSLTTYPSHLHIVDKSTVEVGVFKSYTPGTGALTIAAKMHYYLVDGNFSFAGIALADASGTQIAILTLQSAGGTIRIRTGVTGTVVNIASQIVAPLVGNVYLLIQRDASTNYTVYASNDGFNFWVIAIFSQVGTIGRIYLYGNSVTTVNMRIQFDFIRVFVSQTLIIGA